MESLTPKPHADLESRLLATYDTDADMLLRHCILRVRDRERAKDIVQESFARTWDYLAKGKEVTHIRAFLFRVANNIIVDESRRKRSSSLDAMHEDDGFEAPDPDATDPNIPPDARLALRLVDTLDPLYREPIVLRFVEGLTPGEIAEALQLSENVVSVRIHRGIAKLRTLFEGE